MTKPSSKVQPRLTVLSAEQIEQVHGLSLGILSRVGLRADSARALKILSSAGAGIRVDGERVFIQPEKVEWAIKVAPSAVKIYNRHSELAFTAILNYKY